jgi:hypothetical protein
VVNVTAHHTAMHTPLRSPPDVGLRAAVPGAHDAFTTALIARFHELRGEA